MSRSGQRIVARYARCISARFNHRCVRLQFVRNHPLREVRPLVAQSAQGAVAGCTCRSLDVSNRHIRMDMGRVPRHFIDEVPRQLIVMADVLQHLDRGAETSLAGSSGLAARS
jgi:hypothetical protein